MLQILIQSLDPLRRCANGFWLFCLAFLGAAIALASMDAFELSSRELRLTLAGMPAAAFIWGAMAPLAFFRSARRAAAWGGALTAAFAAGCAKAAGVWHGLGPEPAAWLAMAALAGAAWGLICHAKALPAPDPIPEGFAALRIVGDCADWPAASLAAAIALRPDWEPALAFGPHGAWAIGFGSQPGLHVAFEFEAWPESEADSEPEGWRAPLLASFSSAQGVGELAAASLRDEWAELLSAEIPGAECVPLG